MQIMASPIGVIRGLRVYLSDGDSLSFHNIRDFSQSDGSGRNEFIAFYATPTTAPSTARDSFAKIFIKNIAGFEIYFEDNG